MAIDPDVPPLELPDDLKPQQSRRGFGWVLPLIVVVILIVGGFVYFQMRPTSGTSNLATQATHPTTTFGH
jgi:hypothetical protein